MTRPTRDAEVERLFLAATASEDPGWPRAVGGRLDAGQGLYGDAWATRSLAELLDEIDEEALDIAAWSVLAVQALDSCELAGRDCERVASILARAAREAAGIHDRLRTARRIVETRPIEGDPHAR